MPATERRGHGIALALAWLLVAGAGPAADRPEGFGAVAAGERGPLVLVTSLGNAGPGTLRAALQGAGPRRVAFRVAGRIELRRKLEIRGGAGITIDGATAPAPGITLSGHGLLILESRDVIVRHLRVRAAAQDGIAVTDSQRVVIEHCSVSDAGDENVSITENARDVTVAWSLIADTVGDVDRRSKGLLIASFRRPPVTNVTLHHNLIVNESQRSPQVSTPGLFDMRNNVIVNWAAYGARVRQGARGNIVNNVFAGERNQARAVVVAPDAGPVWVEGNLAAESAGVERAGTAAAPQPAAPVTTLPADVAAAGVVDRAGAWPADLVDERLRRQAAAAVAALRERD
jgi:pectate lyase